MNLGHAIGTQVRDQVRDSSPARSNAGYWHQLGSIAIERVREVVEAYDPVRYEIWQTQDDERTCPICGQLDGEIWPAGEGFTPPIHDHCRCQRVYHHTEFRRRLVEQWRDIAVPQVTWVWRTE